MRAWLRRLLGVPDPIPPRLTEVASRLSDVEQELAGIGDRFEKVNTRITNAIRAQKGAEDAPGEANGAAPSLPYPPVRRIRRNY